MPGSMDGLGLASTIRSLWPRTKIVVTSGLVRLHRQDLAPGIAFISKPAPDEMLLKLISVPGRR
jgi:CheY-like chemotaxis protein